ncbi:MAG: hypothetical protein KAU14_02045, partial [Thermoplasmata archaeon]|nr:hypothetical protein [Thermoplasmata archaeon]
VVVRYGTGEDERVSKIYFYIIPSMLKPNVSNESVRIGEDFDVIVTNLGPKTSEFNITIDHCFGRVKETNLQLAPDAAWSTTISVPVDTGYTSCGVNVHIEDITAKDHNSFCFTVEIRGMELDIALLKKDYNAGESIGVRFSNTGDVGVVYNFTAKLGPTSYWDEGQQKYIRTPRYHTIRYDAVNLTIPVGENENSYFPIPRDIPSGRHELFIEGKEWTTGRNISEYFYVTINGTRLDISINTAEYNATDIVNVTVENTGAVDVNFTLTMRLHEQISTFYTYYASDPSLEREASGSVDIGKSQTIPVNLSRDLHSNKYRLVVIIDITNTSRTIEKEFYIHISGWKLKVSVDRFDYNATQNIEVTLLNTGSVDSRVNLSGVLDGKERYMISAVNISVPKGQNATANLTIPRDATTGRYMLAVTAADRDIGLRAFTSRAINITGLDFELVLDAYQYNASDNMTLGVRNTGGVPAAVNYTVGLVGSWYDLGYTNTTIEPGRTNYSAYTIPSALVEGPYLLVVNVTDLESGLVFVLKASVFILGANLSFNLSRQEYDADETIEVIISNTGGNVTIDVVIELVPLGGGSAVLEGTSYGIYITRNASRSVYLDMGSGPALDIYLVKVLCLENTTQDRIVEFWGQIEVRGLELEFEIPSLYYDAGDTIGVYIVNTGGTDANLSAISVLRDCRSLVILENTSSHTITKNGSDTVYIALPTDIVTGRYTLYITARDSISGQKRMWNVRVEIEGLFAYLNLTTRPGGFVDEVVDIEVLIEASGILENATLGYEVFGMEG